MMQSARNLVYKAPPGVDVPHPSDAHRQRLREGTEIKGWRIDKYTTSSGRTGWVAKCEVSNGNLDREFESMADAIKYANEQANLNSRKDEKHDRVVAPKVPYNAPRSAPSISWDPTVHTGRVTLSGANVMVLCMLDGNGDPTPISLTNPLPIISGTLNVDLTRIAGIGVTPSGGLLPASLQAVGNALGNSIRVNTDGKDFINVKLYDASETAIKTDSGGVLAANTMQHGNDAGGSYFPQLGITVTTATGGEVANQLMPVVNTASLGVTVPDDFPTNASEDPRAYPQVYETGWNNMNAYPCFTPCPVTGNPPTGTQKAAPAPQMGYPLALDNGTDTARYTSVIGSRMVEPYDYNSTTYWFNHEAAVHPQTRVNTGVNGMWEPPRYQPAILNSAWQYADNPGFPYYHFDGPVAHTLVPILSTTDQANFGRSWDSTSVSNPQTALRTQLVPTARPTVSEPIRPVVPVRALNSKDEKMKIVIQDDVSESGSLVEVTDDDAKEAKSNPWHEIVSLFMTVTDFKPKDKAQSIVTEKVRSLLSKRVRMNNCLTVVEATELCDGLGKLGFTLSNQSKLKLT